MDGRTVARRRRRRPASQSPAGEGGPRPLPGALSGPSSRSLATHRRRPLLRAPPAAEKSQLGGEKEKAWGTPASTPPPKSLPRSTGCCSFRFGRLLERAAAAAAAWAPSLPSGYRRAAPRRSPVRAGISRPSLDGSRLSAHGALPARLSRHPTPGGRSARLSASPPAVCVR